MAGLLSDLPAREFGNDVEVAEVARVLLHEMEQDAFERRRLGTFPATSEEARWPKKRFARLNPETG